MAVNTREYQLVSRATVDGAMHAEVELGDDNQPEIMGIAGGLIWLWRVQGGGFAIEGRDAETLRVRVSAADIREANPDLADLLPDDRDFINVFARLDALVGTVNLSDSGALGNRRCTEKPLIYRSSSDGFSDQIDRKPVKLTIPTHVIFGPLDVTARRAHPQTQGQSHPLPQCLRSQQSTPGTAHPGRAPCRHDLGPTARAGVQSFRVLLTPLAYIHVDHINVRQIQPTSSKFCSTCPNQPAPVSA